MQPTQAIVNSSLRTYTTTDELGRQLILRRPTALDILRLFKAAGPALAQNEPWLAMASLATSVREIDGIPVPAPINESQIEALIERLGEEGLAAIAKSAEADQQPLDDRAQVGNSLGTQS